MSRCNFSYLPKDIFLLTSNLKHLLLDDNELKGDGDNMKFMEHVINIQELNLNFNGMVSIEPNVFYYNRHLMTLKLISNPCYCYIADMWNRTASKSDPHRYTRQFSKIAFP